MKVTGVVGRPVLVPLERPVRTASGTVDALPLVLIDLETSAGIVGRSYVFAYYAYALPALERLVASLGRLLEGEPLAPARLSATLHDRVTLLGSGSLVGIAISGLDLAAWDALGQAAGLPLAVLLGGAPTPLPAYKSVGMLDPPGAARLMAAAAEEGFAGVKLKIGLPTLAEDLEVVRQARRAAPGLALMVDYNQSLSVDEAVRRGRALDDEGLAWIEEPVRAGDLAGCARVAAEVATPIQLGENFNGWHQMADALALSASDLVMPDVAQIGGVTGWLRAAALAEAAGLRMSSHLFPEISAHLLAVTPTAHWLEFLDLAGTVLAEPARVVNGTVQASDMPGLGLVWDEAAVARFAG